VSRGAWHQGQPDRSTCTMPLITRRSSNRGCRVSPQAKPMQAAASLPRSERDTDRLSRFPCLEPREPLRPTPPRVARNTAQNTV
jgi:hypothetical protein